MADRARSLVMDLYGEYLVYAGNSARTGALIELMSVLGVEPATTRMTLSRMRRDGWFETHKIGRESVYTLTEQRVGVLADGRARIFRRDPRPWDGWWTQVVYYVPESARLAREGLRKQLTWLGFGQLSNSVWLSPHPVDDHLERLCAEFTDATVDVLRMRSVSTSDAAIARRCWDLQDVDQGYRAFIDTIESFEALSDGAEAFAARTRLAAEARRLTFIDPRLPVELQPEGWLGDYAFEAFIDAHVRLGWLSIPFVEAILGRALEHRLTV